LQKNYVAALIAVLGANQMVSTSQSQSDVTGIARVQLMDLQRAIKTAAASSSGIKRSHLVDLDAQIQKTLYPK
jgi:hypothetical protein